MSSALARPGLLPTELLHSDDRYCVQLYEKRRDSTRTPMVWLATRYESLRHVLSISPRLSA